jgi:hypothetical protein
MTMDRPLAFGIAATAVNGMMVGATLDQSIKQLPARHRIGPQAYSAYAQAADFVGGVRWYPPLALATLVTTGGAIVTGFQDGDDTARRLALAAAGAGTIGHFLATARAAPTFLSLRGIGADEAAVAAVLNRFARLQAVRAAIQTATLGATVWALARKVAG